MTRNSKLEQPTDQEKATKQTIKLKAKSSLKKPPVPELATTMKTGIKEMKITSEPKNV